MFDNGSCRIQIQTCGELIFNLCFDVFHPGIRVIQARSPRVL